MHLEHFKKSMHKKKANYQGLNSPQKTDILYLYDL